MSKPKAPPWAREELDYQRWSPSSLSLKTSAQPKGNRKLTSYCPSPVDRTPIPKSRLQASVFPFGRNLKDHGKNGFLSSLSFVPSKRGRWPGGNLVFRPTNGVASCLGGSLGSL